MVFVHEFLFLQTGIKKKWETRNCEGSHTINAANVGSTRDLISQKNVWRQVIDCKADTTWKTFRDTNMTRTDKVGSCFGAQRDKVSRLVSRKAKRPETRDVELTYAPKHALPHHVFQGARRQSVKTGVSKSKAPRNTWCGSACFGAQVSSKYGTSFCNLCALAFGLA